MLATTPTLLCELDVSAQRVLRERFPDVRVEADVRDRWDLPGNVPGPRPGFPCQDLSQAGRTAGIGGTQSGLVGEVFRRLAAPRSSLRWLLLENVSFMLQLDRGQAMRHLVAELEARGFSCDAIESSTRSRSACHNDVDAFCSLASRDHDPRGAPEPGRW